MNNIGSGSLQSTDKVAELRDLKSQDHEAFKLLVRQNHASLLNLARAIVGDSIAEEVVQESWVSAYKALPSFEGRSAIKTWLYTIVSNHAKTRLRKESRSVSLDEAMYASPLTQYEFTENGHWDKPVAQWHIETPDSLLEQAELQKCIDKTLSSLPETQKAVFSMRDLEQLSLMQICNILAISESNTRVLLHRARVKLMQVITHYQETGTC